MFYTTNKFFIAMKTKAMYLIYINFLRALNKERH